MKIEKQIRQYKFLFFYNENPTFGIPELTIKLDGFITSGSKKHSLVDCKNEVEQFVGAIALMLEDDKMKEHKRVYNRLLDATIEFAKIVLEKINN
jgi:hypothetical protein